jgi:hypothetical protein
VSSSSRATGTSPSSSDRTARRYPLYEFTSSPLTSRPPSRIDAAERDNPDIVPGTLVLKRQFGMIRVRGPGDDRRVTLESYDSDGALLWRHEIRARDLRTTAAVASSEQATLRASRIGRGSPIGNGALFLFVLARLLVLGRRAAAAGSAAPARSATAASTTSRGRRSPT